MGTDADTLVSLAARSQMQPVGWPNGKKLTPEAFLARGLVGGNPPLI